MSATVASAFDAAKVAVCRLPLSDPTADRELSAPEDAEWIAPLLYQNAVWFCRLRWIVVSVLCLAGVGSLFPEPLRALGLVISPGWPLGAALFLTGSNLVFVRWARAGGHSDRAVPVSLVLWAQIVSDLLVLTAVIHWLGHGLAAAPFMYLFHIILACIVFTPAKSLAVAGLAAGLFLTSLLMESVGLLSRTSVLSGVPNPRQASISQAPSGMSVVSMLLIWAVIWYLVSRLASALRSRDRELFLAHRRLKASVEERSNHMLQTTHQLKAPFAAIHAQAQLLLGEYCGTLPAQARATVEKISARCLVLARQIQEMLQLANLRSQGQAAPPRKPVNLASLIEEAITRLEPAARERSIRFSKEIQPVLINGVEDHLTMLVDNLLVNAVNYSYDRGVVNVTCQQQKSGEAVLIVRDQGIGIPAEKLPRIFDDYYRTEEAVQHNRGSTGLGLAIVRQVACKNQAPITVESAPGWGTRFTVTLPGAAVPSKHNTTTNHH